MFFDVKLRLSLFVNSNDSFFVPQPQLVDFLTTSSDDPGLLKTPCWMVQTISDFQYTSAPCVGRETTHGGSFLVAALGPATQVTSNGSISHVPSTGIHWLIFFRAWTKMSDSFLPWSKLACVQTHICYAGSPYCLVTYRRNVLKVTTSLNEWLLKLLTVPSQSELHWLYSDGMESETNLLVRSNVTSRHPKRVPLRSHSFDCLRRAIGQKPLHFCWSSSSRLMKGGGWSSTFHHRGGWGPAHVPPQGIHPGLIWVWYQTLNSESVGCASIYLSSNLNWPAPRECATMPLPVGLNQIPSASLIDFAMSSSVGKSSSQVWLVIFDGFAAFLNPCAACLGCLGRAVCKSSSGILWKPTSLSRLS